MNVLILKILIMKRATGFYDRLCTIENIDLADKNARKGKIHSKVFIEKHDKNRKEDNLKLLQPFKDLTYKTSKYDVFKIYEPKEREIYRLPYYPDRIAHHAIMNVVKEYWTSLFITNTYSCIEGRGISKCAKDVKYTLNKYKEETKYCLKIDIKKFYPSIKHNILKKILRWKIKDEKFLTILDEIIDSVNPYVPNRGIGVPIGNYLSQFFANLYLTQFDHYIKEVLRVKFYFRYADDCVFLASSKQELWDVFNKINKYLNDNLELEIKPNYAVFEVDKRGIDFVGYVFYHNYTLLRKSIKIKVTKLINAYKNNKISEYKFRKIFSSYYGWFKLCNSKHYLQKVFETIGIWYSNFNGKCITQTELQHKFYKTVSIELRNSSIVINLIYDHHPRILKKKLTKWNKQYILQEFQQFL